VETKNKSDYRENEAQQIMTNKKHNTNTVEKMEANALEICNFEDVASEG